MLMDVFPARIRALQAMYEPAHMALCNWGLWSRDRAGIFPVQIVPPRIFDGYQAGPDDDGYGAEGEAAQVVEQVEVKAERAEDDPYDELQGFILDERMHGPGGLPDLIRQALKVAYVHRYVREEQYTRQAGCSQDAFCERLEAGLRFAGRFI